MSDEFKVDVPRLETERLVLRPFAVSDAADLFAYSSDPEVVRYVLWPRHLTLESSQRFIVWLGGPGLHTHALVLQSTGRVIGMVFLHSYNAYHQRAELAFNLSRSHWRQGYVTEAARRIIEHAFSIDGLALHRIEATCMMENLPSARVLARLGFSFEGTLRQSHQRGGQFFDMRQFALLSSDPRPA